MQILAHRGIIKSYPENSMAALMSAVHGDFRVETDLHLTKDNQFLIIHDETLERLTGQNINVSDITIAEATQFAYLNNDQRLVSLSMFLDALKIEGKHPVLALHLKSTNQNEVAYTALSAIFKQYNLHNQAFIFDLTLEAARTCKQIDPEIDIALIISDEKFEPTIHLWDEVKLETCFDIVWAAEYRSMYTKELFLEMQQLKGRVYAMSPDVHKALGHPLAESGYEETWKKLIEWKVNGICTDEPYKLQQLLKAQTL